MWVKKCGGNSVWDLDEDATTMEEKDPQPDGSSYSLTESDRKGRLDQGHGLCELARGACPIGCALSRPMCTEACGVHLH